MNCKAYTAAVTVENEDGALLEWFWLGGKPWCREKYLSHRHFICHRSHLDWRGIERGLLRWGTDDCDCRPIVHPLVDGWINMGRWWDGFGRGWTAVLGTELDDNGLRRFRGFLSPVGRLSGFYLKVDSNRVVFDTAEFTECVRTLMLLET
jgi:hypothetical protein